MTSMTTDTPSAADAELKTISLAEQLRASRQIYANALADIDRLNDAELRLVLERSDDTIARVLGLASDDTIARVLGLASDGTIVRMLGLASDGTIVRMLGLASDGTIVRMLGLASDDAIARVQRLANLQVPVVLDLDQRVAEQAEAGRLNMSTWHCGTTHCRAGWAVTLAGAAGQKLEASLGRQMAGRLIYEASTGRPAPDFFASTDAAIADIRRCAAEAV